MDLPLPVRVRKLGVEVAVELHHKLAHLHYCDILPDASTRSGSELDGTAPSQYG